MAKEFKRLVFHKGSCDKNIPGPKLDRDLLNFQNISNWPSSLMVSLKKYFDEIIYLISVPNRRDARPPAIEHGIRYEVVPHSDLISKWINECDVYFHRATPYIEPPTKPLSVYYSSGPNVKPEKYFNGWDVILTSMFSGRPPNSNLGGNLYSWVKGDNDSFWCPAKVEKDFDFVVVGGHRKRIDHVKKLAKNYPNIKIATVGWGRWVYDHWEPKLVLSSINNITEFGRGDHIYVRDILRRSKIGIAATQGINEAFPMQTQMEYSLTGLYTVYGDTILEDGYYVNDKTGEKLSNIDVLKNWEELGRGAREYAIKNFSSEVSARCLMEIISSARKKQ